MSAPKGNQYWKERSSHGRKLKFKDPEQLLEVCEEYFQWVEDNPLQEEKLFAYQGKITRATLNKMRAMTLDGLRLFLGISDQTWRDYRKREDFLGVTTRAEQIIRIQKFEGAAADLLNANIIARDLGLADKKEHGGPDGGPIDINFTIHYIDPDGTRTDKDGNLIDEDGNPIKPALSGPLTVGSERPSWRHRLQSWRHRSRPPGWADVVTDNQLAGRHHLEPLIQNSFQE